MRESGLRAKFMLAFVLDIYIHEDLERTKGSETLIPPLGQVSFDL